MDHFSDPLAWNTGTAPADGVPDGCSMNAAIVTTGDTWDSAVRLYCTTVSCPLPALVEAIGEPPWVAASSSVVPLLATA